MRGLRQGKHFILICRGRKGTAQIQGTVRLRGSLHQMRNAAVIGKAAYMADTPGFFLHSRVIAVISLCQYRHIIDRGNMAALPRKGMHSIFQARKDQTVDVFQHIPLIDSITAGNQAAAPCRYILLIPNLICIFFVAVEDDLLPCFFQLEAIRQQFRVMEMINIRVHGSCGLIDLFRAFGHALAAAFEDFPHADDMDTVFLIAFTAFDQIDIISGFCERYTFLMEDADVLHAVSTGHVADLEH